MKFARADYQGSVQFSTTSPPEIERELQLSPFPSYPPMDYAERPGFSGYRYWTLSQYFCVSHFSFEGVTDDDNRPVLSATVAFLTADEFADIGRDIVFIRDFLRSTENPTEAAFEAYHQRSASIDARNEFERVVGSFSPAFLGDVLDRTLTADRIPITYSEADEPDTLIRVLFNILPLDRLRTIEMSSVCTSPDASDAENIFFFPTEEDAIAEERIPDDGSVDLRERNCQSGVYSNLGESIFTELVGDYDWYDIGWEEKRSILRGYLDGIYSGNEPDMATISPKLARMRATVERIESLEASIQEEEDESDSEGLIHRLFIRADIR